MQTRLSLDRGEKLIVAETMQDVEPILERNKVLRSMTQQSDWGRHIGSIPNVIITKWLNEEWAAGNTGLRPFTPEFDLLVQKKLNDPDWKYLRTDSPTVQHTMGWVGAT
jgi:hypothetical protein